MKPIESRTLNLTQEQWTKTEFGYTKHGWFIRQSPSDPGDLHVYQESSSKAGSQPMHYKGVIPIDIPDSELQYFLYTPTDLTWKNLVDAIDNIHSTDVPKTEAKAADILLLVEKIEVGKTLYIPEEAIQRIVKESNRWYVQLINGNIWFISGHEPYWSYDGKGLHGTFYSHQL